MLAMSPDMEGLWPQISESDRYKIKKLDHGNDALAQSFLCVTPTDQLLGVSARALALIFWIKSSISLPGLNVTTFFAGT